MVSLVPSQLQCDLYLKPSFYVLFLLFLRMRMLFVKEFQSLELDYQVRGHSWMVVKF